jgi:hypothetical protein
MKKITMEILAGMVTRGFNETKTELRGEIKAVEKRLSSVENRLSDVDGRLSSIEFLLSSNRIERLEDSMRQVKTILKTK